MKKVLTIAGSDCSGGAGIQADLKTMTAFGVYGMSVITALTAQNTQGVYGVLNVNKEFTRQQLKSIFEDIFPDAVKIGMVSDVDNITVIKEELEYYHARNVILDTVMVSTSGHSLIKEEAKEVLIKDLIPMASLITPNIAEAEVLAETRIANKEDMIKAAKRIADMTSGDILIKGGHLTECADDMLYRKGQIRWFHEEHVDNENTHGTGCTLSSAIACGIAQGMDMEQSIFHAKQYITGAIKNGLDIGKGRGPLNHMYAIGNGNA